MTGSSWTHRLARVCVRPLVGGPVTPNHVTTLRLVTGLAACTAFAVGRWDGWAGILWVLSAFLDRADGELARLSDKTSPAGHAYDYVCDLAVNSLVFLGIGIGLRHGLLGGWAMLLGFIAGACIAVTGWLSELLEQREGNGKKAYYGAAGFDLDDLLYLFGPLAWLGWLGPVLIGTTVAGPCFTLLTWVRLRNLAGSAGSQA